MTDTTGRIIEHTPVGSDAQLPEGYDPFRGAVDDTALDDALAETRRVLAAFGEQEAERPADPGLANVRNAIRREYDAAAAGWAERRRRHLADPARSRYKPEGLTELDAEFERQVAAERTALRDRLAARLDVVEDAVRGRIADAGAIAVEGVHTNTAVQFVDTLWHTTPRHGAALLADFIHAALDDASLAYAALPMLRSMYERPCEWQRDHGLAQACEALRRIVEARPGAARAAADLGLVEDTRRQLGFHADAAADATAWRFGRDALGNEVPLPGGAGANLEWSGSKEARELFGEGPSLSGREPVAAAPPSDDGIDPAWRPYGGVARGKRPADVPGDGDEA